MSFSEKNFYNKRKVSFYADELNIAPDRLTTILKDRTGKTAKEHIEEIVLSEAKILLRTGKYNVSEVASILKYENVEEFSRFFKKENRIHSTAIFKKQGVRAKSISIYNEFKNFKSLLLSSLLSCIYSLREFFASPSCHKMASSIVRARPSCK